VIAASAILVVVAFVTLILGIFQSGLGLIWVSIASSVLAAIFLLLGVVQTRPKVAVAGGAPGASPWSPPGTSSGTAVMDRPEPEVIEEEAPTTVMTRPAPAPTRAPARGPAKPATRARPTAAEVTVVVIPDRDKFHKDTCRYAKSSAAMTMSKAAAKKEGYKACGICKP
jgi:hypothetical protein